MWDRFATMHISVPKSPHLVTQPYPDSVPRRFESMHVTSPALNPAEPRGR